MEKELLVSLVTSAQKGDSDAQSELFGAFYNDVYYFALKTVKDEDLACDITQEAFIEIINTIGNLKEPAAFVTWMKQITYHQCTRYFKKKKDVIVSEDEDGGTIFDNIKEESAEFIPDEALDQNEFKKTVLAILDELSEEQRSATMMYYFDELSVKEIAEIQGVSEGTVKSRLNYARKAIKASVEEYEKKNGIKLHAFGFFPLFRWLLSDGAAKVMPAAKAAAVAEGVSAATGATVSVAAATTAATAATATVATGITAKIVAGIIAATVVIGGTTTAVILSNRGGDNGGTPTSSVTDTLGDASSEDATSSDEPVSSQEGVSSNEAPTSSDPDGEVPATPYTIPAGATYITYDGTTYNAGQTISHYSKVGDKLITADYTYMCGYLYQYYPEDYNMPDPYLNADRGWEFGWSGNNFKDGDANYTWGARVNDMTKESYEPLLANINNGLLYYLDCAFAGCEKMKYAPEIPDSVVGIGWTFASCYSLLESPKLPPVWDATGTFRNCLALKKAPVFPNETQHLIQTFVNCTSLVEVPALPANVYDIDGLFNGCTSLATAPVIPASVKNFSFTFNGCTSLTGTVTIHGNPDPSLYLNMTFEDTTRDCFADTVLPITLTGDSDYLAALAATATNGNVTLKE